MKIVRWSLLVLLIVPACKKDEPPESRLAKDALKLAFGALKPAEPPTPGAITPPPVAPIPPPPAPPPSPPAAPAATFVRPTPAPRPADLDPKDLGFHIELTFLKEDKGDAVYKLVNNNKDCALKELGYKAYVYDTGGQKVGGSGGGKVLAQPIGPGKTAETKFYPGGAYQKTPNSVPEVVITSVDCADGKKWAAESARSRMDRPMLGDNR